MNHSRFISRDERNIEDRMTENQLDSADREKIKRIYFQLKAMRGDITSTAEIEVLLAEALQIAESYGKAHPLYLALHQTNEQQLKEVSAILPRSKNRVGAVANLRLYFMGDLLGWFDKD
jgi:hypothetical protein